MGQKDRKTAIMDFELVVLNTLALGKVDEHKNVSKTQETARACLSTSLPCLVLDVATGY